MLHMPRRKLCFLQSGTRSCYILWYYCEPTLTYSQLLSAMQNTVAICIYKTNKCYICFGSNIAVKEKFTPGDNNMQCK